MLLYCVIIYISVISSIYIILSIKRRKQKEIETQTPDLPMGFGYKTDWLAVRGTDNIKVAQALNLNVKPANWKNGIESGYSGKPFITPSIDGWILVLGMGLDDFEDETSLNILKQLSLDFGACQSFLTNRTDEYHSWAKLEKGKITRAVRYFLEDEKPYVVLGEKTAIEKKLNFVLPSLDTLQKESFWEDEKNILPNEETVMAIAENWSTNPALLESRTDLKGLGLVSLQAKNNNNR